jgi:alpha-galactosidase
MFDADILRLDSADSSVIAEQQLSRDGDRFVVFAGKATTSAQIVPRPLQLTGLNLNAMYIIELINKEDCLGLSRGNPILKYKPIKLSGSYLMNQGITLPWSFPESMWVLEGKLL